MVATKKDPSMNGRRFVILRPQLVDDKDPSKFRPGTNTIVALDGFGAGEGELVLFCQGSSARLAPNMKEVPVGRGGHWNCGCGGCAGQNRYTTPGNPPHSLHQAKLCRPSVLARAKLVGREM